MTDARDLRAARLPEEVEDGHQAPTSDLQLIARWLKVAQADYMAKLAKGKKS